MGVGSPAVRGAARLSIGSREEAISGKAPAARGYCSIEGWGRRLSLGDLLPRAGLSD